MSGNDLPAAPRLAAFTILEVLACLLVLALGSFAILGMIMWGQRVAAEAQARATGFATAQSVLLDTAPPTAVGTDEAPGLTSSSSGAATVHKGYLNGYYVVRSETVAETLSADQAWIEVEVGVFKGVDGGQVASVRRRLLRQGH